MLIECKLACLFISIEKHQHTDRTAQHAAQHGCQERPVAAGKGRLWACLRREVTLQKRTLVVVRAKVTQVAVIALVAATLFLRTHIHPISPNDGQEIAGFLFFATLMMLFNGIAFLSITVRDSSQCWKL